jgi:hypothetical protein
VGTMAGMPITILILQGRDLFFSLKPGFMMMKVKTRSHDDEICFFFSSKFHCVNFKNTVIISVIAVSLSCNILSLIDSFSN